MPESFAFPHFFFGALAWKARNWFQNGFSLTRDSGEAILRTRSFEANEAGSRREQEEPILGTEKIDGRETLSGSGISFTKGLSMHRTVIERCQNGLDFCLLCSLLNADDDNNSLKGKERKGRGHGKGKGVPLDWNEGQEAMERAQSNCRSPFSSFRRLSPSI